MTKKEFRQLEKICKDEWKRLAESGESEKDLPQFINDCPACEISRQVNKTTNQDCVYCPITRWRKRGSATSANCQYGEVYEDWVYTTDSDASPSLKSRKKAAKTISKLEWSFIPEYKQTDMKEFL